MTAPLAIDLFCGLGGWTDGLIAEGYDVIGFDIEQHEYGDHRYAGQLVIQDVLTLHGSRFKDAALIVASPPCQEYSYMAMPWKLAKAKAAAIRADTTGESLVNLNRLFNACFRIQAEASLAAGRHIPLIIENVRGAQPWVGRARWNFGSFYLWGDVPALMPPAFRAQKYNSDGTNHGQGSWFAIADSKERGSRKVPGFRFDGSGKSFQSEAVRQISKGWRDKHYDETAKAFLHEVDGESGTKIGGDWFGAGEDCSLQRKHGSKSKGRKMASAMIAKIPLPLSRHIGACYR
jgi:hypothetical protein